MSMRDIEPLILIAKLFLSTLQPQAFRQEVGAIDWETKEDLLKKHKLTAAFQAATLRHKPLFDREIAKQSFIDQSLKLAKKRKSLAEIERIQTAFQSENICVLPYKGLMLATQFYGDLRQRDTGDVDFSIDKKHLPATKKIMESLGYQEKKGASDFTNLTNSRAYYIDYSWVIYDEEGHIEHWIEFHWQAANYALFCPYLFENLASKSTTLSILGHQIQTFSKVEHALIIMIHHGIVDGWGELRHLVDLVKVMEELNDEELLELVKLTEKYKVYTSFCMGISIAEKVLDFKQVRLQPYHLKTAKIAPQIKAILSGAILGDWSEKPIKLWYYLRMRDSLTDRLKSVLFFVRFFFIELRLKLSK